MTESTDSTGIPHSNGGRPPPTGDETPTDAYQRTCRYGHPITAGAMYCEDAHSVAQPPQDDGQEGATGDPPRGEAPPGGGEGPPKGPPPTSEVNPSSAPQPTGEDSSLGTGPPDTSEQSNREFVWPEANDLPPRLAGYQYTDHELTPGGQARGLRVLRAPDGREVVVKVMEIPREGLDPVWQQWRELARSAGAVQLEDAFDHGGFAYEVTPYYPRGSLNDWLQRHGAIDPGKLESIVDQLARTLHHAHTAMENGMLVHRDIRPTNIVVASSDPLKVLLTDFGAASVQQHESITSHKAKSLHYASPGCLAGVSHFSDDWWALGMTVAELALGSHPFTLPTAAGQRRSMSDDQVKICITSRSMRFEDMDDRIRQLCEGLTQSDPSSDHRWRYREIRQWLAGQAPQPAWSRGAVVGTARADSQGSGSVRAAVGAPPPEVGRPPRTVRAGFNFAGRRYDDPVMLAYAICESRRSWQDAGGVVVGGRYADLELWARSHSEQLARSLARLREEFIDCNPAQHTDRCVAELVIRLHPQIEGAVFRGRNVAGDGLLALAMLAQDGDVGLVDDLNTLYESGSLFTLSRLEGQDRLSEIAERWAGECELAEGTIRSRLPEGAQDPPRPEIRIRILAAILSDDFAGTLARLSAAARTRPATRVAWFRALSDEAARTGSPALHAVVCAAHPIAIAGEPVVNPQVQAAVRPFLEEVADQWRAQGGAPPKPPESPLLLTIRRPMNLRERVRPPSAVLVRLAPAWAVFIAAAGFAAWRVLPLPAALTVAGLILLAGVGLAVGAEPWARPARRAMVGASLGVLAGVLVAATAGWAVGVGFGTPTGIAAFWTIWVLAAGLGAMGGMRE